MSIRLNKFLNETKWSYRKNLPDVRGLLRKNYPGFIFSDIKKYREDIIPVFVFHTATVDSFEKQLQYLKTNGYVTLTADEFYDRISGAAKGSGKEILLTFDDGSISLWSTAFPLLEKYDMKAVSFILPGLIKERESVRQNLRDVWEGKIQLDQLPMERKENNPLCSWQEIENMHRSGIIDFQSHTMYHALIPISNKVIDFFNPNFNAYYFGNIFVPLYRKGKTELIERKVPFGTPIYDSEPRTSRFLRFFDDENIREKCQSFVVSEGGKEFFNQKDWKKQLNRFFRAERKKGSVKERFENKEEQRLAIFSELRESKQIIEQRLNKSVQHLCYPWFVGSAIAMEQSKEAGYKTNFWGSLLGIRENLVGSNPFKLVRLEDRFIFRLPGKGRKSLRELMVEKVHVYGKLPSGILRRGRNDTWLV